MQCVNRLSRASLELSRLGQGHLVQDNGLPTGLNADLRLTIENKETKKRAKAEKCKYKRLLGRYRNLKKENEVLRDQLAQGIKDMFLSNLPEGWEYLSSATDELDRKFKLSVKNFEALLNQVSLARAIDTVTQMTSRLMMKSRIMFNYRLGELETTRDYLSQVARIKKDEFEVPRPKFKNQEIMILIQREEKFMRKAVQFQEEVNSITEFIARVEAKESSGSEIRWFEDHIRDYGAGLIDEWMIGLFKPLKEEARRVIKESDRGRHADEVRKINELESKLKNMQLKNLERRSAIEKKIPMMSGRYLGEQEGDAVRGTTEERKDAELDIVKPSPEREEQIPSRLETLFKRKPG